VPVRAPRIAAVVALGAIGIAMLAAGPPSPAATARDAAAPKPRITSDEIPFGKQRKGETAAYSRRHYGLHTWRLRDPRVIVLHYTASSTYAPAWNAFASNAPVLGELPGTCAHFIIGKNGTIHRIVPLRIQCRHTIGLNYTSIGIEMVQEQLSSSHASDRAILGRAPQIHAALHLVRWLEARYGIKAKNVIGHAMANDSPYFKDHEGWRNDHTDWQRRDVRTFRSRLARLRQGAESSKLTIPGRFRFGQRRRPPACRDPDWEPRGEADGSRRGPDPRRRARGPKGGPPAAPPAPGPRRRRAVDGQDGEPGRQPARHPSERRPGRPQSQLPVPVVVRDAPVESLLRRAAPFFGA
jgi:hypothetical protein